MIPEESGDNRLFPERQDRSSIDVLWFTQKVTVAFFQKS